jgi:GNAT superfamily N-acetyltransferase
MTGVLTDVAKVDRARRGDRPALERLFAECGADTISDRFFAPRSGWPARYLAGALAEDPRRHDALVVRYGDGLHVAALASLVADDGDPWRRAELGLLVADRWQRRGLGTTLVEALLARAVDRGVEEVAASVLPHRAGLLHALRRRLPLVTLTADGDCLTGVYRIDRS